jgi:hypothetical protein
LTVAAAAWDAERVLALVQLVLGLLLLLHA